MFPHLLLLILYSIVDKIFHIGTVPGLKILLHGQICREKFINNNVNLPFHNAKILLHNGKVYILEVKYILHRWPQPMETKKPPPSGRDGLLLSPFIPATLSTSMGFYNEERY
jgi:hypothetical protein